MGRKRSEPTGLQKVTCTHEGTTRVLASRKGLGYMRRRVVCKVCASRWWTWEIHEAVVKNVGTKSITDAIATYQRGEQRRLSSAILRQKVERLLSDGWKPTAIAHECGITDTRVRQIRAAVAKLVGANDCNGQPV